MLRSLIASFLIDRRSSGCTPRTVQWHEDSLRQFQLWIAEHNHPTDPRQWTPTLLREYIVHTQDSTRWNGKTLAGSTVTSYVQSVLSFTRWLHAEEVIERDITKNVRKPPPPHIEKRPPSSEDLHKLLSAAKQTKHPLRDYALLCVLIDTGLRANEALSLTVSNVSFEQSLVFVHNGKGRKDRAVPFSLPTAKALRAYIYKERSSEAESDVLFLTSEEKPLKTRSLHSILRRISAQAGVVNVHPHLLRHTFALHFLKNGGDSLLLQRMLGHTSLVMTNRYVNMSTDDLAKGHLTASPLANLTRRKK